MKQPEQSQSSVDAPAVQMALDLEMGLWPRGRSGLLAFLRHTLTRFPDHPAVWARLAVRSREVADWRDGGLGVAELIGQKRFSPFDALDFTDDPVHHHAAARQYALTRFLRAGASMPGCFQHEPPALKPVLRIGYLSADFREHATSHLAAELFERHDRRRVTLFGYSLGRDDGTAIRRRIVHGFDSFVELGECSDDDAARRIHQDGIDILVDLNGYTAGARTGIVWRRPAPIQVNYLGFPGTMAADCIDYVIGDPVVLPDAVAAHFSEQPVVLPDSYQCNDSTKVIAAARPSRREVGLPPSGFVFCCFNPPHKLTPAMFERWMRLLQRVKDAVLWLLESNEMMAANLRRDAAVQGVAPERLVFAPFLPLPDHLARLGLADLCLDTQPYGAHTTASDALWAGVPVVTCLGRSFAGRVAASLLTVLGLPELIASDPDAYETLALHLANHRDELAALRRRLSANRLSAPLFDCGRFTTHLETAYEVMWAIHCDGGGPRGFGVVPHPVRGRARA